MRHVPGWQPWETYVNEQLGLDPTVASGSQFHDKGDGVDRVGDWPFQVDSKYTDKLSYSIKTKDMRTWIDQAHRVGRHFALAVRCWARGYPQPHDYVVIEFELFKAMRDRIKELEDAQRAG